MRNAASLERRVYSDTARSPPSWRMCDIDTLTKSRKYLAAMGMDCDSA